MKRAPRQEQAVPANGCCKAARGVAIASNPACGGGRAARCAATAKDLEDDHGSAAARTWRAMIGRGVRIGCIPCRRRGGLWDRGGDQLPGACDVGFAAGTCEQPIMADAVKSLGQDVKQEAPDELVSSEGHRAIPLLPVTAVILVAKSDTPLVESDEGAV